MKTRNYCCRMNIAAHLMNLIVQDSLNDASPLLQTAKAIVSKVKHSIRAMQELKDIQEDLDLPVHRLLQVKLKSNIFLKFNV